MKKKVIILVVVLVLLGVAIVVITTLLKNKETSSNPDISVSVKSNQKITSPLQIDGKVRGFWFFEASFPIQLIDGQGNILATAIAQAQSDWMTSDFVNFKAQLDFVSNVEIKGFLIFKKDNPSGLPENDAQLKVPVIISQTETSTIKAFFNNNQMDPQISCNKVFAVERIIPKTQAVGRAAIEELLKGPTEQEKAQGFSTSINPGVIIQSLVIENNTAKIDFSEDLEAQVGGSCRVSAIRAQITETLKQFETVKNVIISINGKTGDILQP
jgi:spore germination protein GerM